MDFSYLSTEILNKVATQTTGISTVVGSNGSVQRNAAGVANAGLKASGSVINNLNQSAFGGLKTIGNGLKNFGSTVGLGIKNFDKNNLNATLQGAKNIFVDNNPIAQGVNLAEKGADTVKSLYGGAKNVVDAVKDPKGVMDTLGNSFADGVTNRLKSNLGDFFGKYGPMLAGGTALFAGSQLLGNALGGQGGGGQGFDPTQLSNSISEGIVNGLSGLSRGNDFHHTPMPFAKSAGMLPAMSAKELAGLLLANNAPQAEAPSAIDLSIDSRIPKQEIANLKRIIEEAELETRRKFQ